MTNHNFTDAKFLTAKEKTLILKNWKNFLGFLTCSKWQKFNADNLGSDYGLKAPKQFTNRLYKHLHLHCGFIAHYNIHGFYSTYFNGDYVNANKFFSHFENDGYRHTDDYDDINKAMAIEYQAVKNKIFTQAQKKNDDRFELLKECFKRAETDLTFRNQLLNKLNS